MKFLNDKDYKSMAQKAEDFDKVVKAVVENGENINPDEVTSEVIISAMQQEAPSKEAELLTKIESLEKENASLKRDVKAKETKISELQSTIDEMDEIPAEESAAIVSKGEQNGKAESIIDFATKNQGNPFAILAEMEKQGYLNK